MRPTLCVNLLPTHIAPTRIGETAAGWLQHLAWVTRSGTLSRHSDAVAEQTGTLPSQLSFRLKSQIVKHRSARGAYNVAFRGGRPCASLDKELAYGPGNCKNDAINVV